MELGETELAAIRRCVRSQDFITGFEAFLQGLKQAAISKMAAASTEVDMFRAQGEHARVKIILDFAKMQRIINAEKTERA